MKKSHLLRIKSLNDAQADCTCGHWGVTCTGERTRAELRRYHKIHKDFALRGYNCWRSSGRKAKAPRAGAYYL